MGKKINNDKFLSNALAIYCMLMPFEEALASSFGSILKIIGIIIIIYCIVVYKRTKIKIEVIQTSLIIWFILSFTSYFWSESLHWWAYFIRIYIGQIALFLVLTTMAVKKINLIKLGRGMIFGAVIAAGFLIFSPGSTQFTDEGRRTIMLFNTTLDPNIVCALFSLGFFSLLDEILSKSEKKQQIIPQMLMLVMIIIGVFLTGSRGGLIAIFSTFIIWIMLMHNRINRKYSITLILLSIGVIIIGASKLPEALLDRFTLDSLLGINEIESGSHSRYIIWSYTYQLFLEKPFLGYGSGNFFSAIASVYRPTASHNMFILVLIENGFIGFIFFIYPIYLTLKSLLKGKEYTTLMMFMAVLIICFFLDGITYKFFWVTWTYAVIKLNQLKLSSS